MAIHLSFMLVLSLCLLYSIQCITSSNKVNNVHVSMTANFDSVPLVFEISEFSHDYHTSNKDPNKLYFNYINKFIDYYHNKQSRDDTSLPTQENIYEWTISSFTNEIGQTALESLELALSLNHYTPRLVMFEQLYQSYINNINKRQEIIIIQYKNNKPIEIIIENDKSISKVTNTINNIQPNNDIIDINWEIFELHDHWIGNTCFNNNNRNILVIYYGDYLSNTFNNIYNTLSNNNYCFILRPISLNKSLKEFNLQGYGVELAIKNMEYNVTDDRNIANVQVDTDGNVESIDDNDNTPELVYTQLIDIFHGLIDIKNISNLPKRLEMEEENMKIYMNSIDIQATKGLLSSYDYCLDVVNANNDINVKKGEKDLNKIKLSNNKFLSLFREFSTNFPRYVDAVSHVDNETFQYLLPYLQTMQRYQREGQQSFSFNGINLATDDFDVFNFYHILHKEAKFVDMVMNIMDMLKNNKIITILLTAHVLVYIEKTINKTSL